MNITFNGETKTDAEWSAQTGITRMAMILRIRRGWSPERTLTTPNYVQFHKNSVKNVTKTEAERYLNDLGRDEIPSCLRKFLTTRSKRHGTILRERFRPYFDKWFEEVYIPAQTKEKIQNEAHHDPQAPDNGPCLVSGNT